MGDVGAEELLGVGFGGVGDGGFGAGVLDVEVVTDEAVLEDGEGFFRSVGELEEVEILEGDGSLLGEHLKVDDVLPVTGAVDDDGDGFGELVGLVEGEEFEHLVEGAEAAGEDDEGLGEVGEPELAHEEVVEVEVEGRGDVGVGELLEGELDVEADGFAAGLVSAAVGGLHDAGATAGGDDETVAAAGEGAGPLGGEAGEGAGVLVVTGHLDGGFGAAVAELGGFAVAGGLLGFGCGLGGAGVVEELELLAGDVEGAEAGGAEEDDGVLDALATETGHGLVVLGEDAEGAGVGRVEKVGVLVGERGVVEGEGRGYG